MLIQVCNLNITGLLNGWEFLNGGDRLKIIEIAQWGNLQLGNNGFYFLGAQNLQVTATDTPNLVGTTNMAYAFSGCTNLGSSGNFNSWNVSQVTDMDDMFYQATSFNQPLNNWKTSSVTIMKEMFSYASSFNQPISTWDVSHVTNMFGMFLKDSAFNQPLNNWNVSQVTFMDFMFERDSVFNQTLSNWDVFTS